VKLSFSAPFFGSFFGRAKNEQRKVVLREQSEKHEPQNHLQPSPDSYRDFFGNFFRIKAKKVTWISLRNL
jgi:hypothetical protein